MGTRKRIASLSLESLHVHADAVRCSNALKAILKGTHKTSKAEKVVLYGEKQDITEEGFTKEECDLFEGYKWEQDLYEVFWDRS